MPNTRPFQETWQAYQEAVTSLYRAPEGVTAATDRSAGEIYAERLEERSQDLLDTSAEVRESLSASIQVEDLAQRELASLKLLAAAAYDLSIAGDILALEEAGPSEGIDRAARDSLLASTELRQVLEAPIEGGMLALLDADRAALPSDPLAARATLEKTIATFLIDIPDDASSLGQAAMGGVANLGLGPAQAALSLATQEILARVPEGISIIGKRAAALVVEAVQKLRASLGEEHEQQVQEQTTTWMKELQEKRDSITSLLDRLYETSKIGEETNALLTSVESLAAEQYNQATKSLQELLGRYAKTKGTLTQLMRVLSFVKTPLMGAAPWGPLALYSTYAGILAYAVYSGGDYLDWYRTGDRGWLDRVEGLRTTVSQSLRPATATV